MVTVETSQSKTLKQIQRKMGIST